MSLVRLCDSVWVGGIVADNVAKDDWVKHCRQEIAINGVSKRGRVCVVLVGCFHCSSKEKGYDSLFKVVGPGPRLLIFGLWPKTSTTNYIATISC